MLKDVLTLFLGIVAFALLAVGLYAIYGAAIHYQCLNDPPALPPGSDDLVCTDIHGLGRVLLALGGFACLIGAWMLWIFRGKLRAMLAGGQNDLI